MRLQLAALVAASLLASSLASAQDTRVSSDVLFYTDTDNVVITTPQVAASHNLDDEGGVIAARTAVDVISAASVDVVSQATNRFSEVRYEASLSLAKSFSGRLPSLSYRFSQEPDYVSHGGRAGFTTPIESRDTTLALGYGLNYDTVKRAGTPASVFSENMTMHVGDVSLTQVVDSRMVLRLAYTVTRQSGYLEKPYRQVPLFTASSLDQARADGVALGLDNFSLYALSGRPAENVPDTRLRHAIAGRLLRYLPSWSASVKLDYQLYVDDWGVLAHTVEPAVNFQLADDWTLRGLVRIYLQKSADFWQKTYSVTSEMEVPRYRTLDRSLTSYVSLTGGARVEWTISPFRLYADLAAMNTTYNDYLFLDSRTALIGQTGARWEF